MIFLYFPMIFAQAPMPNCRCSNPRYPDSDPKIIRKKTWKQAWLNTFLWPKVPKSLPKRKSLRQLKVDINPSLDVKMSFRSLPNVPGLSQNPPGRQSGGTKYAQRQVWAPKIWYLFAKMQSIHNHKSMSNGQGPAAEGVAHTIIKNHLKQSGD